MNTSTLHSIHCELPTIIIQQYSISNVMFLYAVCRVCFLYSPNLHKVKDTYLFVKKNLKIGITTFICRDVTIRTFLITIIVSKIIRIISFIMVLLKCTRNVQKVLTEK